MIVTVLAFIVVLGVIIFVHELGHFIAAKMVGIRVDTFSLGFPPKMISKKIGGTEYVLAWIPLGGYVKMAGMIDESLDDKPLTGAPWEFMSKSFLQKLFVISAGVIMNFLLGIIVFTFLTWYVGVPGDFKAETSQPIVGYVRPDFPAAAAGMQAGDRIVTIAGDSIRTWQDLTGAIHPCVGESLLVQWQRGDELFSALIVPVFQEFTENDSAFTVGLIGINPVSEFTSVGIIKSIGNGIYFTGFIIIKSLEVLKMLIFGEADLNEIAGPIGIAQISGQTIRSGLIDYFSLIAQVSVSIGLLNILPFPVLDGGHIIFISLEAIIRRPISSKVKLNIQKIGMALLLALFLLVSYNDILKLILRR